jgi:hypothetical protein
MVGACGWDGFGRLGGCNGLHGLHGFTIGSTAAHLRGALNMTRLERLIAEGLIYIEGDHWYVGLAIDCKVDLGEVEEEDKLNKYLEEHPTPADW